MAMRPRGLTGGVQAVYEDFRPVSEWKQDNESHILNIYLPGFGKEETRVSTEGRNTIRVNGERLVAGNKWSRFLEDFQVPENGEMNSVLAKFQGGILNITVPIKQADKPQQTPKPKGDDVQNQPTNIKDQDSVFQEERSTLQRKTSAEPSVRKGQDEKSLGTQKALDDNKRARDPIAEKEKSIASNIQDDDLTSNTVDKEKKKNNDMGTKELLPESESPFRREGIPEKKADGKILYGDMTKKKYKKAVEGLAELNEERQLLVNMGAAMLAIVALTAYVTYKFASGKDKN